MGSSLRKVAGDIRTGDLLAWRPVDKWGEAIAVASASLYSHVGMACWMQVVHGRFGKPRLYSLDMVRDRGGVVVPLVRWVEQYPGKIDVFAADPDGRWRRQWNPKAACQYWLDTFLGRPYGVETAARMAKTRLAWLRWLVRPYYNDSAPSAEEVVCSESVATACQHPEGGNVDTVLQLAPRSTWPGDLTRSLFYRKKFEELVP